MSLSIVLPACNEERNIEGAIQEALHWLDQSGRVGEVIVVDDGSTDSTAIKVQDLADRRVKLVQHQRNLGYGAALRSGFRAACYEQIFFTDADMQFRLQELNSLLDWSRDYEIVVGYRAERADPIGRRLNAWGWNVLINRIFHLGIRDVDCAFKLFHRSVFERVGISSIGAFVNSEILVRAQRAGFRIKEVPVSHYPRRSGRPSGARLEVIGRACWELATIYPDLQPPA